MQDCDSAFLKEGDMLPKDRMVDQIHLETGNGEDGRVPSSQAFAEQTSSERVADAKGPFVDRVKGHWHPQNHISLR